MNQQPGKSAYGTEAGRHQERRRPAEFTGDRRRQAGGQRAAQLAAHVHKAGNRTCGLSADIRAYRPERALREIQRSRSPGQHYAGKFSARDLRRQGDKNSTKPDAKNGQTASSSPFSVSLGEPVTGPASGERTGSHREKRQHGVERTVAQVQAADRPEIDEEPGEEDVSGITVSEVAESNRQNMAIAQNRSPRQLADRTGIGLRQARVDVCAFLFVTHGWRPGASRATRYQISPAIKPSTALAQNDQRQP